MLSSVKVRALLCVGSILGIALSGWSQEPARFFGLGLPKANKKAAAPEPAKKETPSAMPVGPVQTAGQELIPAPTQQDPKVVEAIVADYLKREAAKKKEADEEKKATEEGQKLWSIFGSHTYDLQTLYDSLSDPLKPRKQLSIRGYTQIRYGRSQDTFSGTPNMFADRTINGTSENFLIRRARVILSGDVSDHLFVYIQPDFASTPQSATTSVLFNQLRDLYADVYVDTDKVHRFRVGLSKVPYGWENCQSSQNRVPLDRTDAMNTAVAPNERDLGVIYYWTPVEQQKLLKTLVDSGLKGSNNFGIFAFGVYNGQGGAVPEFNNELHTVMRLTWPVQFSNGQVVEASVQGYRGRYLVQGAPIRARGVGPVITPAGTSGQPGGYPGIWEQRVAATFVVFPQPFGFQAEWQTGEGPGLSDLQNVVDKRPLNGGYVMATYRHDTEGFLGIFTPYFRYQQYRGGYRNQANAPYGNMRQYDIGVEWQIAKELEFTVEYNIINTPNFTALGAANSPRSYTDYNGTALRFQLQFNY